MTQRRARRASLLGGSVLVFATLLLGACGAAEPVASFRLPTLDGAREIGPPDYRGQVVVVDFWATWCAPCHVQARILEELRPELEAAGVQVLSVNQGEAAEKVGPFVAENPVAFPVLLDPEERLGTQLGIVGLPTIAVIGPEGEVLHFEPGIVPAKKLRELVASAKA